MINDNEIDSLTIANYFLTRSALTPKKIQKIVYYAYSWFIALNNENANEITNVLFNERPEAWLHGPVFPNLYNHFREFNWHEVPRIEREIVFENSDINDFLDNIWNVFGELSADELEYMTHQELPWINARKNVNSSDPSNNLMSLEDIFNFYNGIQ